MSQKAWPPPGFPIVEGDHPLTATWSVHLPEPFARRVEDGSLVLWRPELTIWLDIWHDGEESRADRLAAIREDAAPERFEEREESLDHLTRFSYRLRETSERGRVESLNGFILSETGSLYMAIYFDDPADEPKAYALIKGVHTRTVAESGP